MVRKVSDKQKGTMLDDVEREKENIFYCLHPAVSKVSEVDRSVIFRREKSIKRNDTFLTLSRKRRRLCTRSWPKILQIRRNSGSK